MGSATDRLTRRSRWSFRPCAALLLACVASLAGQPLASDVRDSFAPGVRVLLDAHNCYPDKGEHADRIDRALATGLPVAIEQDLIWRPAENGRPARSIVAHGAPFTGQEPGLREHFFERVRPLVERALADPLRSGWPVIVLNLDFKTNEPEHHRAIWDLLGEYESWLTTAERTSAPGEVAALSIKPVLVLTGDDRSQQLDFHDSIPVGRRLRLFGAIELNADTWAAARGFAGTTRERDVAFWTSLPTLELPRATNYRRWWNNAWSAVERGGPRESSDWTAEDEARLRTLVRRGHDAGLWVRYYTLNGHTDVEADAMGAGRSYNFGSLERARARWHAAIAAGVDFVATDQYEAFAAELAGAR